VLSQDYVGGMGQYRLRLRGGLRVNYPPRRVWQTRSIMSFNLPTISNSADYKNHFQDDVWRRAAEIVCARHGISYSTLQRTEQGENFIFFVDESYVVKIYAPFRNQFMRESEALRFVHGKSALETPEAVFEGEIEGYFYLVMTKLSGTLLRDVWSSIYAAEKIEIAGELGAALREFHAQKAALPQGIANWRDWNDFVKFQAENSLMRQTSCGAKSEWIESLPAFLETNLRLLPAKFETVFLHGDVHAGNLLARRINGRWRLTGLFDFGDAFCGFNEYELIAPGVLMFQGNRAAMREFLLAYGYQENDLDETLRARLMLLTILYECSDLRKYALRLAPEAVNLTLRQLESAIWKVTDK
jgi:hygromycin-B 7''-O-kinase